MGAEWWFWPLFLFFFTLLIGIISPVSGVGGGVLYVPLATVLTPFNVDFIRGAGLVMAVTSALTSVPYLVRKGLANIRLFAVIAPIMVITSVLGGMAGLWVTNAFPSGKYYVKLLLGIIILLVFFIMLLSKKLEFPEVKDEEIDSWSKKLGIFGEWYEPSLERIVHYRIKNLPIGVFMFGVIGFVAGMFGLGAGWANVPLLNMIMGAPIKVATATSMLIITANAPAIGIYLAKGAVLPVVIVPSILGITIGARIGAKIAEIIKPAFVRWLVIGVLFLAGILNIIKGLEGLGVLPHII
ncbi:MAG: sulfite exporter TauE/SafE family protein [Thermodesulfobacteria bacterium]|nr:sulfite exporter TauE/SafE family protein [Thermodesulfobacteriota bacterium]